MNTAALRTAAIGCAACILVIASPMTAASGDKTISFDRDIRPILSNNCYRCHGPDDKERKADLRLDIKDGLFGDLGGHVAVAPGKPEDSELLRRVVTTEPGEQMPPPKAGKALTPAERELLTRWIKQGAPYNRHWSYVKPVRPALPVVRDTNWPINPIDRFLLARREKEGLKPAPRADRYTLIRRVSLDLTGLPPTWQEVQAFVQDPDPRAYEKLVDRLLQKSTYGEYWAHLWLDLARYADSSGYADDPLRTIWLFRDYVIKSLNANKPFDQFTIEQIAGDLLPNPTEEQLIATAFHRNTLTNNEGGTIDEEFRNVAVVDRVGTTMAVWMGTTMACAQCHNHKYDPITQEEFFRFFAFFNNTQDADRTDESPLLSTYTNDQKTRRQHLQKEIAAARADLVLPRNELVSAQARWEESFPHTLQWNALKPNAVTPPSGLKAPLTKDGLIEFGVGAKKAQYTIVIPVEAATIGALQLQFSPTPKPPEAKLNDGNFVIDHVSAVLEVPGKAPAKESRKLMFQQAVADVALPGSVLDGVIKEKNPKATGWIVGGGKDARPQSLTLVPSSSLPVPAGSMLILTVSMSSKQVRQYPVHLSVRSTTDTKAAEWGRTPAAIHQALKTPQTKRSTDQVQALQNHFRSITPELASQRQKLAELEKQLAEIKPVAVPIMREQVADQRRLTKIQHRGNYVDLGQTVTEGVPVSFAPLPPSSARDRLALARWLVAPENPLTPRVLANRCWEQIFGVGIVATSEDFGIQGDLPIHPELLDWLAVELVDNKWNLKAFLKLLVTSAAYQQSSVMTPELERRDPDNRLLARGPRFRLSAETVRDQALFAAGILSEKMFGPPVNPPQPAIGLRAAFGSEIDWKVSAGEDRHRRGLYTMWRRSNPYPSMAAFDAPNREVCTVRRVRTNTPLQALVTMNDPVYMEAAQALARRTVAQGGATQKDKIRFLFEVCLSREPQAEEIIRISQLHQQTTQRLRSDPKKAEKLAVDPVGPPPPGSDLIDLAAWTIVANVMLNLDETLMKR
ncbi:PSD1 and planctomycete cytochrome C domain-containing protein [soil metagenome]